MILMQLEIRMRELNQFLWIEMLLLLMNLLQVLGSLTFKWGVGDLRGSILRAPTKMSKLDRYLVTHIFFNQWPGVTVIARDRVVSDHTPIVLKTGLAEFGPSPFKTMDYTGWTLTNSKSW